MLLGVAFFAGFEAAGRDALAAERFAALAPFLTLVAPLRDDADRALLDRLLFALLLLALRVEALLADFLRDFLALVAI